MTSKLRGSKERHTDSENSNFRTRVEAKAKHDAEWVHLPWPINYPEALPEDICQEPGALEAELAGRSVLLQGCAIAGTEALALLP